MGDGRGAAVRLISGLVRLYPAWFRERYGADLVDSFADGLREAGAGGGGAAFSFFVRTAVSVMLAAVRERWEVMRSSGPGDEPALVVERTRYERRRVTMFGMVDDIRYGLRFLRRNPSFTAIVLLTLALGIGMNTAVFSVLYGALYAPYPYGEAERIVQVGRTHPQIAGALLPLSPGNFYELRARLRSFESLEAAANNSYVYSSDGGSGAARYSGLAMTPGYFEMLKSTPAMGRTFAAADDEPGAAAVAVVSDGFWRAQLGGEPDAVGRTIRLNDEPHTVIGVMPAGFALGSTSIWVPLRFTDVQRAQRGSNFLQLRGRLAPGATVEQAITEVQAAWIPIRDEYPAGNEDTGMSAIALREWFSRGVRSPLLMLAGAAAFVLLIACANVANLMLVRAERRQREVGVRAALGARRGRLAAQFLTEGIITAFAGGLLGVGVGWAGVRALVGAFGNAVPRSSVVGLNTPVLLFSLFASVATGLLVGMAPALRRDEFDVLREGSRGATSRLSRTGRLLVIGEVALAIMLVTGAGLLIKSYARATTSDLGFDAGNLVATSLWFPQTRYTDNTQTQSYLERLNESLVLDPRIESIAMSGMVPIRDYGNNFTEIGAFGTDAKASFVESRYVTPTFFDALAIRFITGRNFSTAETSVHDGSTVIINRTLAKQLFGDADPLGGRLVLGPQTTPEVIGVVDDLRDFGPDQAPRPTMYRVWPVNSTLLIRSHLSGSALAGMVREKVRELDPAVEIVSMETMQEILDRSLAGRRFQLTLLAVFAGTALVLACVGIYGVLSHLVARQTREIGVRMALGARAASVAGQVAWRGGQLAVAGVALGVIGSYLLRQTIATQLFETESFDPMVYAGVVVVLLTVATLACLIPARRASGVDPIRALREE